MTATVLRLILMTRRDTSARHTVKAVKPFEICSREISVSLSPRIPLVRLSHLISASCVVVLYTPTTTLKPIIEIQR
jgi:hypothetical protein